MTSDRAALADRLIPDIERAVSLARDFIEGSKPYNEAVRSVALDVVDTVLAAGWKPPPLAPPEGIPFAVVIPEGKAIQLTCNNCDDIITATRGGWVHYCSAAALAEKRKKA